jgi:hypothetical protein
MTSLPFIGGLLVCVTAAGLGAQEPAWNAAAIKTCDRACLVGILDGSMKDRSRSRRRHS